MFWASHVTPSAPSYIRHDLPGHQFFFQSTQGHNNDQHFTKCVHKPILSRAGGFPPRTPPYAISMPNAPPWSTRPCFASTFAPICLNCIVSGHINMYMYPCPRLVTVHGQLYVPLSTPCHCPWTTIGARNLDNCHKLQARHHRKPCATSTL